MNFSRPTTGFMASALPRRTSTPALNFRGKRRGLDPEKKMNRPAILKIRPHQFLKVILVLYISILKGLGLFPMGYFFFRPVFFIEGLDCEFPGQKHVCKIGGFQVGLFPRVARPWQ